MTSKVARNFAHQQGAKDAGLPAAFAAPRGSVMTMSSTLLDVHGRSVRVDVDDYARVIGQKWRVKRDGKKDYIYSSFDKCQSLARFILGISTGEGVVVKHLNGDSFDCRRENLHACTRSQCQQSVSFSRRNTTGYRGVQQRGRRFIAMISNKRNPAQPTEYLGSFDTAVEAALAYDRRALQLRGPYAQVNFERWAP